MRSSQILGDQIIGDMLVTVVVRSTLTLSV
jgi:hypothetical protein